MTAPLRILLVENNAGDERLIRECAADHSEYACEIQSCTTLDSALAYLTKRNFDIVLLDLSLPDSDGLDTVRRLAKHSKMVPIVVLTGADDDALAKQSIKLGAQDYLIKQTLTPELLCRTVMYAVERSRVRQEILSSESRNRLLFESAPIGISYFTPEGDIIAVNRIAASELRKSPKDAVGMNVAEYSKNPTEDLRRITEAAQSRESTTYEDVVDSERGPRYVLRSYVSLRDATDAVIGVQLMSSDITTQKNAELRFRLAADTASDLIYEWNLVTKQVTWFGDIDATLGYPANTIPRTFAGWESLVHPEDRARLRDSSLSHRTATVPIHQEYRVKTADGDWRTWIDRASPVLDDRGVPTRWIGACEDITSERMAASALEAERSSLQSVMEAM
ncbi:response regulator, partial [Candidatus Bipolaricaulota bacterium]|nr:response regulator [Candidatus Bipolaricaulota bacterium]